MSWASQLMTLMNFWRLSKYQKSVRNWKASAAYTLSHALGTKRHRFISERVELRATTIMTAKTEVGDVTIVTENK
jgi:hypothetical protein